MPKKPKSKRAIWLADWLAQECCGVPQSTGYDVMTFACRHTEYESVTEVAHYADCGVCGNIEILCSKCVDAAVADAQF